MIKEALFNHLATALRQAAPQLNDLVVDDALLNSFRLERPRNPEHGDYAVNVSFLARHTKMAPPKIAEVLQAHLSNHRMSVVALGGYLNFSLSPRFLQEVLVALVQGTEPGRNQSLSGEHILLEYVSANPTGPLHIGHGRWAALGDSIIRLLRHCGADVTAEFYINDAGVQMGNITTSVYWRCLELLKASGHLTVDIPFPESLPYPGEYVLAVAQAFLADRQRQESLLLALSTSPLAEPQDSIRQAIQAFSREHLLAEQRVLLTQMRVPFESWISEKEDLYERGLIPEALDALTRKGFTYEAEDALWFKSTEFGDEKDRVLRKSDGSYTYLMPDIAYHHDKFTRKNPQGLPRYNRILNIWGADHHGYIPRMRGAIQALCHPPEQFEVLLGQLVNLIVDGERTRMGKRRKMLTLQDVVDEVGVDATRFWMVSKSADTALDFDVDLAASATSENPVFYVQYAHARCCSILRNAVEPPINVDSGDTVAPFVTAEDLRTVERTLTAETLSPLFDSLTEAKDTLILKNLLLLLDGFEDVVRDAARARSPHFVTQYAQEVSAQFHSFYGVCRILTPEPALTQARLMLIRAIQKTLAQALDLLGVSAPERM